MRNAWHNHADDLELAAVEVESAILHTPCGCEGKCQMCQELRQCAEKLDALATQARNLGNAPSEREESAA